MFNEPTRKGKEFVIELETRESHGLLAELDRRLPEAPSKSIALNRVPSKTEKLKSLLSSKASLAAKELKKEETAEVKWQ